METTTTPAERPAKTPRAGVDLFCHEQMGEGFVGFKTYAARASSQDTSSSAAAALFHEGTFEQARCGQVWSHLVVTG